MIPAITYNPTKVLQERRKQEEVLRTAKAVAGAEAASPNGQVTETDAGFRVEESKDFRYTDLRRQQEQISRHYGTDRGLLVNLLA